MWLIGAKVYEPEKIRVFLEAMWRRLKPLEKSGRIIAEPGLPDALAAHAGETTALLRRLKAQIDEKVDTRELAARLFQLLHDYAKAFLELYFRSIRITGQIGEQIESSHRP